MKLEITRQEEKLAKCKAFCEKFKCTDGKEKCLREMETLQSLKSRLAEVEKEEAKRSVSEARAAPLKEAYPILAQVTAAAPAWDIIEGVLADEKFETDEERQLALEICLEKLSRGPQ